MGFVKSFLMTIFKTINRRKPRKNSPVGLPVILPISNSQGKFVYYCPGCQANHVINTKAWNKLPVHTISGSPQKPTIRASVLSKGSQGKGKPNCHSYVTDGKITFLSDCTHALVGQTVPMIPL